MTDQTRTKVIITGASGYLGQHLLQFLLSEEDERNRHSSGLDIVALYGTLPSFAEDCRGAYPSKCQSSGVPRNELLKVVSLDLLDEGAVSKFFAEERPDVVVHLAAMSSLGVCEEDPEKAMKVNCPTYLSDSLSSNVKLIFLSTDQVYDGDMSGSGNIPNQRLYLESDLAKPVNVYGRTKLQFENYILKNRSESLTICLRSSLILGPCTNLRCRKQSFLQFVLDRLENSNPCNFFTDEWRSMVYVKDVCKFIDCLVDKCGSNSDSLASGVFNMGGPRRVSRFDLASAVGKACFPDRSNEEITTVVKAVAKSSLPVGKVKSPPDISMCSSKLQDTTQIEATDFQVFVGECNET